MAALPLTLRHTALYGLSLFCASELYQHHFYDWGTGSGPSMYPTLPIESAPFIVNHRHRLGRNCAVGDIVQFRSPLFRDAMVAKRILGMPGDYVVCDESYAVAVGGAEGPWSELEEGEGRKRRVEPRMVRVPQGHVWVVGDNLSASRDSRFYGPVPMALIKGKVEYTSNGGWFGWRRLGGEMAEVEVVEVD